MKHASRAGLVVVSSGICAIAHLTGEAVAAIEKADIVFYLVADQMTILWLKEKRSDAISLYPHYKEGLPRSVTYQNMIDQIMAEVRRERFVVVIFYGHAGVFVYPSHKAIAMATQEGYYARMLPGISAESCLIADLGVDPGASGWQSYEATLFIIRDKVVDPSTPLVLWQIGVIGDLGFNPDRSKFNNSAFSILLGKLRRIYAGSHPICIYEASEYAGLRSKIEWMRLDELKRESLSPICTLYIPPSREAEPIEMAVESVTYFNP